MPLAWRKDREREVGDRLSRERERRSRILCYVLLLLQRDRAAPFLNGALVGKSSRAVCGPMTSRQSHFFRPPIHPAPIQARQSTRCLSVPAAQHGRALPGAARGGARRDRTSGGGWYPLGKWRERDGGRARGRGDGRSAMGVWRADRPAATGSKGTPPAYRVPWRRGPRARLDGPAPSCARARGRVLERVRGSEREREERGRREERGESEIEKK